MISRSDWEPLPTPTLSPLHAGTFLAVGFSLPPCGVCLLCGCRWFIFSKMYKNHLFATKKPQRFFTAKAPRASYRLSDDK